MAPMVLMNVKRSDFTTQPMQCQFCHMKIPGIYKLNKHLKKVHRAKIEMVCKICGQIFTKNKKFRSHLANHSSNSKTSFKEASVSTVPKTNVELDGSHCDGVPKIVSLDLPEPRWEEGMKIEPLGTVPSPLPIGEELDSPPPADDEQDELMEDFCEIVMSPLGVSGGDSSDPETEVQQEQKRIFSCDLCDFQSSRGDHAEAHEGSHRLTVNVLLQCQNCSAQFLSVEEYCSHKDTCSIHAESTIMSQYPVAGARRFSARRANSRGEVLGHVKYYESSEDDLEWSQDECETEQGTKSKGVRAHKSQTEGTSGEDKAKKWYPCGYCEHQSQNKREALLHKHEHTGCRIFKCDGCNNVFSTSSRVATHRRLRKCGSKTIVLGGKQKQPSKTLICDICGTKYQRQILWARHKLDHPENQDPLCWHCGEKFDSLEALSLHEEVEHDEEYFARKERFKKYGEKRDKVMQETAVCEECGMTVKKKRLSYHKRVHHLAETFTCDVCGSQFKTQAVLKMHSLKHLSEKPYKCPFCPFAYTWPAEKRIHLASKHLSPEGFVEYGVEGQEKPCVCEICGQCYTTPTALKEHMIFHGERTVKCKKCSLKFFTTYHLYAHQHTTHIFANSDVKSKKSAQNGEPERKFQCHQCDKSFVWKSDLKYHQDSAHSGTFRFVCEVCGKGTHSKGNMNTHMRQHGGAFNCSWCGERFLTFSQQQTHALEVHGKTIERRRRWPVNHSTGELADDAVIISGRKLRQCLEGLDEVQQSTEEAVFS